MQTVVLSVPLWLRLHRRVIRACLSNSIVDQATFEHLSRVLMDEATTLREHGSIATRFLECVTGVMGRVASVSEPTQKRAEPDAVPTTIITHVKVRAANCN
eukprot:3420488-Amphidinium_carterae.1